jgi:hypothetical protein
MESGILNDTTGATFFTGAAINTEDMDAFGHVPCREQLLLHLALTAALVLRDMLLGTAHGGDVAADTYAITLVLSIQLHDELAVHEKANKDEQVNLDGNPPRFVSPLNVIKIEEPSDEKTAEVKLGASNGVLSGRTLSNE